VAAVNNTAKNFLELHEGLRLKVYKCTAGKDTIAYGRNLNDRGVSVEEADMMLANDIAEHEKWCSEQFSFFWFDLNEARQAVLIDMTHNLGQSGLLQFKRFLAALSVGDYVTASKEMLDSRWAVQVGQRAVRLSATMASGFAPHHLKL
jgi:lysozyme